MLISGRFLNLSHIMMFWHMRIFQRTHVYLSLGMGVAAAGILAEYFRKLCFFAFVVFLLTAFGYHTRVASVRRVFFRRDTFLRPVFRLWYPVFFCTDAMDFLVIYCLTSSL